MKKNVMMMMVMMMMYKNVSIDLCDTHPKPRPRLKPKDEVLALQCLHPALPPSSSPCFGMGLDDASLDEDLIVINGACGDLSSRTRGARPRSVGPALVRLDLRGTPRRILGPPINRYASTREPWSERAPAVPESYGPRGHTPRHVEDGTIQDRPPRLCALGLTALVAQVPGCGLPLVWRR